MNTVNWNLTYDELKELYTVIHLSFISGEERAEKWLKKIDKNLCDLS